MKKIMKVLFIENNTQNKEKKKLINLMKLNKIDNSFLTLKKKEKINHNENWVLYEKIILYIYYIYIYFIEEQNYSFSKYV